MSREPQRRGLDVDIWERVGPPELRGKDPWEPLLLRVGESRAGGGDLGESPDTRAQAGPAHAWEETLASSSVVKVTLSPQLAMASGTGGSWSHPPAQTAAPMVKAESGSGACLYLEDLVGRRGWGA